MAAATVALDAVVVGAVPAVAAIGVSPLILYVMRTASDTFPPEWCLSMSAAVAGSF